MAISLATLRRGMSATDKPPRLLIYGDAGIGKTTLASEFPAPVFLNLEDGAPKGVQLDGWGREDLPTFGDVMKAIDVLYNEDHDFQTLVVDSVTTLQRLIFAETCARGDEKGVTKKNVEEFGYGKGYVFAMRVVDEFLDKINALRNDRGMGIVLIAHSTVHRFDDPETVAYDRYEIALRTSDKSNADLRGAFQREVDGILLVKKDIVIKTEDVGMNRERAIGSGGGNIWIHTTGRPAYIAKNRYGMPDKILYKPGQGFAELSKYLTAAPAPVTAKAA